MNIEFYWKNTLKTLALLFGIPFFSGVFFAAIALVIDQHTVLLVINMIICGAWGWYFTDHIKPASWKCYGYKRVKTND